MGWLDLFRGRSAAGPKTPDPSAVTREALAGMRTDIDQLLGRVGTIDIAIRRHDDQLTAHQACIEEHRQRFLTLEQKVTIPLAQPMALRHIVRHTPENNLCLSPHCTRETPVQHFDIGRFTEQEKRVLAVFFQNKGMRMSYADLARVLNKSTYTVKNQMNQIRQKADLFECTIGDQSRNLFTLKADLRVEKYLKVGQPIERPVSIPERDQSEVESEAKEAEPVVEYVHERSEAQEED